MLQQKTFTKEQALQKARHYCAYQERCHSEVKEKLYSFKLRKAEVEELLSKLIEEDYLNEERFAQQFAGGKFRMNQWGKIKITHALQQKQVSAYCIKSGLKQIDDQQYSNTLDKLVNAKWNTLKGESKQSRQAKTFSYLLQKGYEGSLVSEALKNLTNVD